jgi:hypothetical protein
MRGKPEVFIIESLTFEDERSNRHEGRVIQRILALSGKQCDYYYIRTLRELKKVLLRFRDSEYRYLHLSCHANEESIATTLDEIMFEELGEILRPYLADRRLFVSGCSMTNEALAEAVMPGSGCFSILGPREDIAFGDAAILWASLYHVMFAAEATAMKRETLKAKAQEVSNMFRVPLRFFTRSTTARQGYASVAIDPQVQ